MSEIKNIQLNGTKLPISGTSGGVSKVFKDVSEIPAEPDSNVIYRVGGAVPNTGTIDKVYFNTSLSIDQVKEQLSKLTYSAELGNMSFLLGQFSEDKNFAIVAGTDGNEYGIVYTKIDTNGQTMTVLFTTSIEFAVNFGLTVNYTGWDPSFNGIVEIDSNIELMPNMDGALIGSENDKIVSLFNTGVKYVNVNNNTEFEFAKEQPDETYYIDITYNQDSSGANFKAELDKVQLPLDLSEDLIKNGKIVIRVKEIGNNLIAGGTFNRYSYYRVTTGYITPMGGVDADGNPYVFINLSFGNTDRSQAEYQADALTINLSTLYTAEDGLTIRNSFYEQSVSASSVTVDTSMSGTSTNPVQNKVIKEYIDNAINSIKKAEDGEY